MANVLFTRKNASEIPNVPITDGQLIFDTSGNGKMYLDNGTDRLEMGGALTVDATLSKTSTNPVQNKAVAGVMLSSLNDISAVTKSGFLTDALAVKELNNNLSANIIDSYSAVDLTLYTSANPYTCPSDGYVFMKCYNQPGNHTTLNILTNKNDYILARCQGDLTNTDFKIIYVKKGMRIYGTVSSSSYAAITYGPFI